MVSLVAQQLVEHKALSFYRDHLIAQNEKRQAGLPRNGKARATAEDDVRDTSFKHEMQAIDALLKGLTSINSPLIPPRTLQPQPESLTVFRGCVETDKEPYVNPFTGSLVVPETPDAPGPSKPITGAHIKRKPLPDGAPVAVAVKPEVPSSDNNNNGANTSSALGSSPSISTPATTGTRRASNRWKRLRVPPDVENNARISAWNSAAAAFKSLNSPTNASDVRSTALCVIQEVADEESSSGSDISIEAEHDVPQVAHRAQISSASNNGNAAPETRKLSQDHFNPGSRSTNVTAQLRQNKAVTGDTIGPSMTEPMLASVSPRQCAPATVKGSIALTRQPDTSPETLISSKRIYSTVASNELATPSQPTSPSKKLNSDTKSIAPASSMDSSAFWQSLFASQWAPGIPDDRWPSAIARAPMAHGFPPFPRSQPKNTPGQPMLFAQGFGSQPRDIRISSDRVYDSGWMTEREFYDREQEYHRLRQQHQFEQQAFDEARRSARRQEEANRAAQTRAAEARAAETSRQLREAREQEESEALARQLQAEFDKENQTLADSEAFARKLQETWDAEVAPPNGRQTYTERPPLSAYTRDRLRSRPNARTSRDPYRNRHSLFNPLPQRPPPPRTTTSSTPTTPAPLQTPTTDCTVCLAPFPRSDLTTLPCGHSYCRTCLTSALVSSLATKPPTPFTCCPRSTPLPYTIVRPFLPTTEHATQYTTALTLSTDPSPLYCSSPSCATYIPPFARPTLTTTRTLIVRCRDCGRETCVRCKKRAHGVQLCEQDENERRMDAMVRREGWRKCPGCGVVVERRDGCMHMTCRCRVEFCYGCGGRWGVGGCAGSCGRRY